ncbi:MAG TPA: hypothetical protein VE173_00590, partial [Longimicrobiales bacterium]|nr:hypothetical protein [Longimicrobiales bacterium]
GLPGLGNFVAEFLVLAGSWRVNRAVTAAATLGIVAAAVYSLSLIQRTFHGENVRGLRIPDLGAREAAVLAALMAAILWLGLFPQAAIDTMAPALQAIQGGLPPFLAFRGR